MTVFRVVTRHVRFWKSEIHRWSNVYHFTGTGGGTPNASDLDAFNALEDALLYGPSASDGGTYAVDLYDQASGGMPIVSVSLFDPTDTGSWAGYGGAGWVGTGMSFLGIAEPALLIDWSAGLSHTGKTVNLRKWYHSVPEPQGGDDGNNVSSPNLAALTTAATALQHGFSSYGLLMCSGSGRFAGSATVQPYYGNHQMPRGRRRKALVSSAGKVSFPASLLVVPGSDGSTS